MEKLSGTVINMIIMMILMRGDKSIDYLERMQERYTA